MLSEGDGADVVEALQQWCEGEDEDDCFQARVIEERRQRLCQQCDNRGGAQPAQQTEGPGGIIVTRSEEHTSELQSLMRISYAVFCLKKKKKKITQITNDETN